MIKIVGKCNISATVLADSISDVSDVEILKQVRYRSLTDIILEDNKEEFLQELEDEEIVKEVEYRKLQSKIVGFDITEVFELVELINSGKKYKETLIKFLQNATGKIVLLNN